MPTTSRTRTVFVHSANARTVLRDPVQRVAGRRAVALVQRADERTCAAAHLGPVTDPPCLPPVGRAREEPGRPLPDPLVQPRQDALRLVVVDQTEAPLARQLRPDANAVALRLDVHAHRGEAVAEAAVDRLLGRPERRHGLAALTDVAELRLHHPAKQALPAVRRQDADDGDARAGDGAAGQRQLLRVRACAGDDPAVVDDGEHPLQGQDLRESLRVLRCRLPAEVVADRPDRPG